MAENENGQEKTEEATPKRLDKAREEGQVPRSRELNTTFVLLSGVAGIMILGVNIGRDLMGVMAFNFTIPREAAFDVSIMLSHFSKTSFSIIQSLFPFFIVLLAAALIGPALLGGWLLSAKAVQPKLERMDPIKGLQRMFSMNALLELIKALAKFVFISAIAVLMLVLYENDMLALSRAALVPAITHTLELVGWSVLAVSLTMIAISVIDVPYQLYDHSKKLKMTLQEVKDEMKDTEGKPEVKGRVRQLQREMAQRRMMEAVPDADVVITNPDHFSVALKYDADNSSAPVVIAKGVDRIALTIRDIAKANEITIIQLPPLARAIYFTTELEQEIPNTLYLAVAQVLAYVFQLKAYRKGKGRRPKAMADINVPEGAQYDANGKLAGISK